MDQDRQELLEIYKLHAELADRVSQRREGANRLYVSLLAGIFILPAAFLKYGTETIPDWVIVLVAAILGGFLFLSWCLIIRSYYRLDRRKCKVLCELEKKLVYPFFKRERELLEEEKNINKSWELIEIEHFLPFGFFMVLLYLFVFGVIYFF